MLGLFTVGLSPGDILPLLLSVSGTIDWSTKAALYGGVWTLNILHTAGKCQSGLDSKLLLLCNLVYSAGKELTTSIGCNRYSSGSTEVVPSALSTVYFSSEGSRAPFLAGINPGVSWREIL